MNVPLSWLTDYVDVEMSAEELAHRLTMAGLKVENVEQIGEEWTDVIVGKVAAIEPHPSSRNPLWVTEVDLGDRRVTIVTGAPNVKLGDVVPVVQVGGVIPHGPDGNPLLIEARPMAGITSHGMLASQRELGLSDEHNGIFILPPDTPVGVPLRSVLGDEVIDIETSPNRPDTLSIIGVAREVAAFTQQQLSLPDLDAGDANIQVINDDSIAVDIAAPDLCSRYCALRIAGISNGASPSWLAERLRAAGMRPISLLVDLTNYVMLEYGQPMHAFDARQLAGNRIVVRRAAEGEHLTTLDGMERVLGPENLVIADGERAVGIAGVMGGENSEVAADTTEIVLESATFDAVSVRRTAQALSLRSEASARFEKSLSPEMTVLGLKRYVQLLAQLSEAPIEVYDISDAWPVRPAERVVALPLADIPRLLDLNISAEEAQDALSLLGFGVRRQDETLLATVPFWRRADIEQSADLVEEVARVAGFEAIPSTLPDRTMPVQPLPPDLAWEGIVRERLLAGGASESVTHSLTSPALQFRLAQPGAIGSEDEAERWADLVPNTAGVYAQEALTLPVELANPATSDRRILRLLLAPSLLDVIARNQRHTNEHLAFFEMGRTIFRRPEYEELPYERRALAIALSGLRRPSTWQDQQPGPFTFFDLKGMIEAVLSALRIEEYSVEPQPHPALHPGRAAALHLGGRTVAWFGQLHPEVAAQFDIAESPGGYPVQVAEIDLDALFAHAGDHIVYHPLPRFPAAYRDLAVFVGAHIPAREVMAAVRTAGGELLESARIFDVYEGEGTPAGQKSLAIGLTFRAPGATLTHDEVQAVMDRIVAALGRDLGAVLRE